MTPILDHLSALADATRCRMMLLLDQHDLTVGELCTVTQLPQSTVSRHLKTLLDAGWVSSRREGTSRVYGAMTQGETKRLWSLVREQVRESPAAGQDGRRLRGVLAERRTRSQEFFASTAGQWDKMRAELFGQRFQMHALMGLLDERWTIGDFGCGTGELSAALAPHVQRVVAVDASGEMLAAARRRLKDHQNVQVRHADLEALPVEDAALDAAVMMLVLHHLTEPADALVEAARCLKPGGRLVIADMLPHDREDYRRQMGHVWLGFSEEQIVRACRAAGFARVRVSALPVEPDSKGPALFVAVATKSDHVS